MPGSLFLCLCLVAWALIVENKLCCSYLGKFRIATHETAVHLPYNAVDRGDLLLPFFKLQMRLAVREATSWRDQQSGMRLERVFPVSGGRVADFGTFCPK